MKIVEYLEKNKNKTFVSFEILPPLKGGSMQAIIDNLDPLMEFNPPFIDVTYHREDVIYSKNKNGYYEKVAVRKRPGTVGICASIMHRYNVEAVPHLICGGFTKSATEDALIDLSFLNVGNILALRGDALKFDGRFIPTPDGNKYAIDLVKQISDMNKGIYLDETISNGSKTDFCIGIAGYPEKHFESPNLNRDLDFTRQKVEAGADYIVTQMFFDNKHFFDYVKKCKEQGINVPIIPGIKPITKRYQIKSIPRLFFISIPDDLVKAFDNAKTDEDVKEAGIAWCIHQSKELLKAGVPCIHYYTMGDSDIIKRIVQAVF